MEKQEKNNRIEACNMAAFALAIPLSLIALAFAKAKPKINIVNITENKTDDTSKPINKDKDDAKNGAIFCFGTARLLEIRRKKYRLLNKIIKFTGISIPVSLGFFVTTHEIESLIPPLKPIIMPIFLSITAFLNIALLYLSIWALVDEWDAKIENYTESISNNTQYYKVFKEILERYDENPTEYATKLKEIKLLDDIQSVKDGKENFSVEDDRYITRRGLYQIQEKCVDCNEIPDIKNPGTCKNCGK